MYYYIYREHIIQISEYEVNLMYKKKIMLLGTGGTIAGKAVNSVETAMYEAGQINIKDLIQEIPVLESIAQIECEQVCNIDSADITLEIMVELRNKINKYLSREDIKGIVVAHGTDTLEETAYFLNLTIASSKPVVLVGAMRPATAFSADGIMNMINAIYVAISEHSINKGVLVVMNDRIYAAREVSKTHTTGLDAFTSLELGSLGNVNGEGVNFYQQSLRKHTLESCFSKIDLKNSFPIVDVVYCVAGMSYRTIELLIKNGSQGIVIAGFGNGNINSKFKEKLKNAVKTGTVIVMSSRVASGEIVAGQAAKETGIICAGNLNPQKARILLILALATNKNLNEIQEIFATH